jgi:hypothetical protein
LFGTSRSILTMSKGKYGDLASSNSREEVETVTANERPGTFFLRFRIPQEATTFPLRHISCNSGDL